MHIAFSSAHKEVTEAVRAGAWGMPEVAAPVRGPAPQEQQQHLHYQQPQAVQQQAVRAAPASTPVGQMPGGQGYRILTQGPAQQSLWNQARPPPTYLCLHNSARPNLTTSLFHTMPIPIHSTASLCVSSLFLRIRQDGPHHSWLKQIETLSFYLPEQQM
jgi:hypothetical protein